MRYSVWAQVNHSWASASSTVGTASLKPGSRRHVNPPLARIEESLQALIRGERDFPGTVGQSLEIGMPRIDQVIRLSRHHDTRDR